MEEAVHLLSQWASMRFLSVLISLPQHQAGHGDVPPDPPQRPAFWVHNHCRVHCVKGPHAQFSMWCCHLEILNNFEQGPPQICSQCCLPFGDKGTPSPHCRECWLMRACSWGIAPVWREPPYPMLNPLPKGMKCRADLRIQKDSSLLQPEQLARARLALELPQSWAETSLATASEFNISLCSTLLSSLPCMCCLQEASQ